MALAGCGLCALWASARDPRGPVSPHRSVLDSKESELKAALQELECERGKERALQSRLQEEHLRHLQKEGQSCKTLEVPGPRGPPPLPAGTCREKRACVWCSRISVVRSCRSHTRRPWLRQAGRCLSVRGVVLVGEGE